MRLVERIGIFHEHMLQLLMNEKKTLFLRLIMKILSHCRLQTALICLVGVVLLFMKLLLIFVEATKNKLKADNTDIICQNKTLLK